MHQSLFSRSAKAARYVRCYLQRTLRLASSTYLQPVTARAVPALDFEFGGAVEVQCLETGHLRTADPAALIGVLTQPRNQLLLRGNTESFVIVFEPLALHQLFRLPAGDHVDCDYPVNAVLGRSASLLQQKLGNARTFLERVAIADECISSWNVRAPASDAIERAVGEISRTHGACRIETLANDTGLSMRSFQRLFQQRVGVPAKLYSRIVRFEAALKTKSVFPQLSWTHIAHKFGYADQMHMIHDFRQLSAKTPTGILEQASPLFEPQIDLTANDTVERLLL